MNRCCIVLGIPRSGSSCVSGVLHKLGIDMGAGHFQPRDDFNKRGYFEDLRWRMATQHITGRGYSLKAACIKSVGKQQRQRWRQLARQCKQAPIWGMKDPWLCFVGQFIWSILESEGVDARYVVTNRPLKSSVDSVARHLKRTYRGKYKYGAQHIVTTWHNALQDRIAELDRNKVYHVNYDMLVARPKPEIKRLSAFCYEDTGLSPNGNIDEIAQWVTPKLKHF